jgi:hypothetical protein
VSTLPGAASPLLQNRHPGELEHEQLLLLATTTRETRKTRTAHHRSSEKTSRKPYLGAAPWRTRAAARGSTPMPPPRTPSPVHRRRSPAPETHRPVAQRQTPCRKHLNLYYDVQRRAGLPPPSHSGWRGRRRRGRGEPEATRRLSTRFTGSEFRFGSRIAFTMQYTLFLDKRPRGPTLN